MVAEPHKGNIQLVQWSPILSLSEEGGNGVPVPCMDPKWIAVYVQPETVVDGTTS